MINDQQAMSNANTSGAKVALPNEHLIWVDMEMSGLDPETERILEIAIIVTDAHLNTIATAPVWVVHQDDAVLDAMDAWNKGTHGRSGLIDKVKASTMNEAAVEAECIAFLKKYIKAGIAPMCGNTIGQLQQRVYVFHGITVLMVLEDCLHIYRVALHTVSRFPLRLVADPRPALRAYCL